jgi:hypothetical protein
MLPLRCARAHARRAAPVDLPRMFIGLVYSHFELIKRKKANYKFLLFWGAYKFNVLSRVRGLRVTKTGSWI